MLLIISSVIFAILLSLIYYGLVSYTKDQLKQKVNEFEKFLDVVKVVCLNAKELSFVGTQGNNESLFFELRFTEKHIHKEIYRLKRSDDIIRFDKVNDNAWYSQGEIDNFHVKKLASIDLRKYHPKNQLFGGIAFGSKIISSVKRYKKLTDQMEEDLRRFESKLQKLAKQRRRVSQGYNVKKVLKDNDVLDFVKQDYNETSG